jgi:hypothetical protein
LKKLTSVLALLLVIAGMATISEAQTVKGGGSATISFVTTCRWDTNPRCLTDVKVVNTSDKFGVTKIILDIPGFDAIETWIPPLGKQSFPIPGTEPARDPATLDQLKSSAIIHTARKSKNVKPD